MTTERTQHWERVYAEKSPDEVSWFQREPRVSHTLITRAAPSKAASILDVGGGASTLSDALLSSGYVQLAVLDIAAGALNRTRARLGAGAERIQWVVGDVLQAPLRDASVDVWHDRAVLHFLTAPGDRAAYLAQLRRVLKPDGRVVIATFAADGPTRCSGLDVVRYSAHELQAFFGLEFVLSETILEDHMTPSGKLQRFTYCRFDRRTAA
ncbi:MAG: class I SAM-dependent methyltransferase [Gemmatimonadaceae bacterium]